jgi:hypothetical protein
MLTFVPMSIPTLLMMRLNWRKLQMALLTKELESVGFDDVKPWTWWMTSPHSYCDDFSQAYIPARGRDIALSHGRLDVGDGLLVSLNLEAVK